MIQMILIGGIVLALSGAWWSHNRSQQEIGKAEAVAEYERQQKEAAEADALRALEGEKYNADLLAKALQRNRAQAVQLAAAQKQRETANVEREKVDPVYKAWADTPVPLYAATSLRQHAIALTATAGSRSVSDQPGVEIAPTATGDTDPVAESWVSRLRRGAARLTGRGVE
jgi:hypothetical protein